MTSTDLETLRKKQALLQQQIDTIEARPEDIFDEYSVLRFRYRARVWDAARHEYQLSKRFSYVAIKVQGNWYVSSLGFKSKKSWADMMTWWERGQVSRVLVATSWSKFDEYIRADDIRGESESEAQFNADIGLSSMETPPTSHNPALDILAAADREPSPPIKTPPPMSTREAVAILQGVSEKLDATQPGRQLARRIDLLANDGRWAV